MSVAAPKKRFDYKHYTFSPFPPGLYTSLFTFRFPTCKLCLICQQNDWLTIIRLLWLVSKTGALTKWAILTLFLPNTANKSWSLLISWKSGSAKKNWNWWWQSRHVRDTGKDMQVIDFTRFLLFQVISTFFCLIFLIQLTFDVALLSWENRKLIWR